MTTTSNGGCNRSNARPLCASLQEVAGPLPDSVVTAVACRPRRSRPNRANPIHALSAIARDVLDAIDRDAHLQLEAVPPAEDGDATLLVLRVDGCTRLMLAVPPSVIRSQRLRAGTSQPRDTQAEATFELLRVDNEPINEDESLAA